MLEDIVQYSALPSGQNVRRKLASPDARANVVTVNSSPIDDAALEEVARVREALRGDLGEPLCGHLTGQRWTGCTPESLRCWIIR